MWSLSTVNLQIVSFSSSYPSLTIMSMNRRVFIYSLSIVHWFIPLSNVEAQTSWSIIDSGLSVAEFKSPILSKIGTNLITILKIDPSQYEFVIVNASAEDSINKTIAGWCSEKNLLGGVNAGMFKITNHLTNIGYLKNFDHVNNPTLTPG